MKFKIGDIVIISSTPQTGYYLTWEDGMDHHCGCSGDIIAVDFQDSFPIYAVRSISKNREEKSWWFQENWLKPDDGYYWTSGVTREEYQKLGLDELKREEESLKEKQNAIFRKMFKGD